MIQHHPNRSFAHFRRKSVALLACHRSTFSSVGVSNKPGAVHFGFKAHFIFNDLRQVVAVKITPGNVNDTVPLPELAKNLRGKIFGDRGYVSKRVAKILSDKGLLLLTRPKKNMTPLPISVHDEMLLKGRSIAETIIGHIKEFSSLRLPKHRSVPNAFTHMIAAVVAYQFHPLTLSRNRTENP